MWSSYPQFSKICGLTAITLVRLAGGRSGYEGSLFGKPYEAGSWQNKLIESFAGPHDMIGGKLTGLYDSQENIKRGLSTTEKALCDRWAEAYMLCIEAPLRDIHTGSPHIQGLRRQGLTCQLRCATGLNIQALP